MNAQGKRRNPVLRAAIIALTLGSAALVAWGFRRGLAATRVLVSDSGAKVTYFRDTELQSAVCTRSLPALKLNCGNGSPAAGVPVDGWSARWDADLMAPLTATYCFAVSCDDGVRFWIDGAIVVDDWTPDSTNRPLRKADMSLPKGRHKLRLEHRDRAGDAFVRVQWTGGPIRQLQDMGGPFLLKPGGRENNNQ